ncbi:glycoside hydrolase family 30 protein [Microbacterium pumilum]
MRLSPIPTSSDDNETELVRVDPTSARQVIGGFGAALTHSSAAVLEGMPESSRNALLRELFDPAGDVRLTVLRIALGGSDFVVDPAYTYDDMPAGEEDWDLEHFSTAADDVSLRPLLRRILEISPELTIIASPWSPPAWLKDSGRLDGGQLRDDDRAYTTYATYLSRAVADYSAAGIPIDFLTVQNEPQARFPDGYPGTDLPVRDQVRLIDALGPLLDRSEPRTEILAYDHNWSLHPADAEGVSDPETEYPSDVLTSSAAPWVDGVAYHCYAGDASRQSELHDRFPSVGIYVTECSGSHGPDEDGDHIFSNTLAWQARNLLIASLGNWASTVMTWNLALDPVGGPHVGGCATCTGVVTVDDTGSVTRNAEFYVLAHAARFIPPGSTALNTAEEGDSALSHTAFRTPSGTVVLLFNDAPDPRMTKVIVGSTETHLNIPGRSLITLRFGSTR